MASDFCRLSGEGGEKEKREGVSGERGTNLGGWKAREREGERTEIGGRGRKGGPLGQGRVLVLSAGEHCSASALSSALQWHLAGERGREGDPTQKVRVTNPTPIHRKY